MKINTNVWYGNHEITPGFSRCNNTVSLISNGQLQLNTSHDKSIYLFNNNNFIHRSKLAPTESDYIVVSQMPLSAFVGLAYNSSHGYAHPVGGNSGYSDDVLIAQSPMQTSNVVRYIPYSGMLTEMNYSNFILLIYVTASKTMNFKNVTPPELETWTGTLKAYKNRASEYPYIINVYCMPAYSDTPNSRAIITDFSNGIGGVDYSQFTLAQPSKYVESNIYEPMPVANGCYFMVFGFEGATSQPVKFGDYYFFNKNWDASRFAECGLFWGDRSKASVYYGSNYKPDDGFKVFTFAMEYNDALYQYIIEQSLKWGFLVTDNTTSATSGNPLSDPNIYAPTIKKGNITNDYTSGTENITQPSLQWENPWNDSGFDPDKIDPNDYTDKIELTKPGLTTTGIFNRTFALNSNNVNELANYLWNADESMFSEIVKGLALMGGNPIDGLIDLRLYPFDVVSKSTTGSASSIVVGRTDTKISGVKINDYNAVLELGSCSFFRYFGNFLDYEPYTTASLYIPYVGIVPISTALFVGQNISCKMVVDITTGSCTAIVFCNNIPMIYKNGTIGVEIPMTATNSGQYASRIVGGLTSAATDLTLGAATGNVGQMISGAGSLAEAALNTGSTIYNTAGTSSPSCSIWQPQNCYFIIQRPVPVIPDNYGHDVGFACNYNATISDLSGYTQTYNVDVSTINAPENEKSMIANILNNGFYA